MLCYIDLFFARLIHDRELTLFDGTRLTSQDRYEKIKADQNLSDEQMTEKLVDFAVTLHIALRCNFVHVLHGFVVQMRILLLCLNVS